MVLKNILKPSHRTKAVLLVVCLISLSAIAWWQYDLRLKADHERVRIERERIGAALRAGGANSQAMWKAQGLPKSDPIESENIVGQDDAEQALQWQKMPKKQRDAMRDGIANISTEGAQQQPAE